MANIRDSLSHTKWLCKYHIVFTPKYKEKQYMDSTRKVLDRYCGNCVITKVWKL